MLLLIFLLRFTYALMMVAIIVSAWTMRAMAWLLVWTWRLGRWCWKRHEQKRFREPRRP